MLEQTSDQKKKKVLGWRVEMVVVAHVLQVFGERVGVWRIWLMVGY